jgi:hypothetical protein
MPEPKTDRSAMGLLKRVAKYAHEDRATTPGTTRLARALAQLPTAARHARNIDKQRRRLLAEKCEDLASGHGWDACDVMDKDDQKSADRHDKRASKLRTIAARLRGMDAK